MTYTNNMIKTPSDFVTLNILLTGFPVISAVLWLFIAPGSSYLSRIPLLPLAQACAALQSFLGPTAQFPQLQSPLYPLASSLGRIIHLDQLTLYSLILIIGILFCRRQHPFRRFEQFSLFYIAIVYALLQNTAWNTNDSFTSLPAPTPQGTIITQPQLYISVINKLLAQAFILIVLTALIMATMSIFLFLMHQFARANRQMNRAKQRLIWVNQLGLRLNHILLLVTTITSIFLLWLFGNSISLLTPTLFITTFNQQRYNLTLNQLIIFLLLLCSIVALVRLSRPFSSIDRWIILIDAIVCALLLLSNYAQQTVMQPHSEIIRVKLQLADPHIVLPSQGAAFGLLFAVLVSFMWVKHRFPQPYGSMLKIGFGLALTSALLQWLAPFFLVVCLISITLSILLSIQVEQIQ